MGFDFHARQQTLSYLKLKMERYNGCSWRRQPEEVRRFYRQFAGQRVVVGFESSGRAAGSRVLEELGVEILDRPSDGHPLFARRRQKNDRGMLI